MKPNILLITGPQGSGNHVFSKCFAMHKDVNGWDDLLSHYWIRHEFEPYGDVWRYPDKIKDMDWSKNNYVLSVSCPYVDKGETIVPNYEKVIPELQKVGNLCVGLIGREEYILKQQEFRLRGTHSYHQFLALLDYFEQFNPVYLSQELLYLYRNHYLKSLVSLLNIPIDYNNPKLNDILRENQNAKYIHYVEDNWLDSNKKYFEREGYVKQLGRDEEKK
jgi:hypothetical protein